MIRANQRSLGVIVVIDLQTQIFDAVPPSEKLFRMPHMAKKQAATKPFNDDQDERYFQLIQRALAVCMNYRPKFGQGRKGGLTLDEFRTLYQSDPFYTWFGLDSPLLYAAHKAAGGMTSVYRQIGTGCERLFQQLLQDSLGLNAEQVAWSYLVPGADGKPRKLSLDGRIPLSAIPDAAAAARVRLWLSDAATALKVSKKVMATLEGPVFKATRAKTRSVRMPMSGTRPTPTQTRTCRLSCCSLRKSTMTSRSVTLALSGSSYAVH